MSSEQISDEYARNAMIDAHCHSPYYAEQYRYIRNAILAELDRAEHITDAEKSCARVYFDKAYIDEDKNLRDSLDAAFEGIEAARKAKPR